eukprot:1198929-Pleurochrysis_carterae.AAC.1
MPKTRLESTSFCVADLDRSCQKAACQAQLPTISSRASGRPARPTCRRALGLSIGDVVSYSGTIVCATPGTSGTAVTDPPLTGSATVMAFVLGCDGPETRRFMALELAEEPGQLLIATLDDVSSEHAQQVSPMPAAETYLLSTVLVLQALSRSPNAIVAASKASAFVTATRTRAAGAIPVPPIPPVPPTPPVPPVIPTDPACTKPPKTPSIKLPSAATQIPDDLSGWKDFKLRSTTQKRQR